MLKYIFVVVFNMIGMSIYSQGVAAEIGYHYKYGNNAKVGVSYRISPAHEKNPLNTNVSYITDFKENHLVSVGVQQRFFDSFEGGLNLTNKDIEPNIGINIMNLAKLNLGYSIAFDKKLKSQISFGIVLALGQKKYYDQWKALF